MNHFHISQISPYYYLQNREAAQVQQTGQHGGIFLLEDGLQTPIGSTAPGDTRAPINWLPLKKTFIILNYYLWSEGIGIIPTSAYPQPASHNGSSKAFQDIWDWGKRGPRGRPVKEGQHRGEVDKLCISSTGNNKCLSTTDSQNNGWH